MKGGGARLDPNFNIIVNYFCRIIGQFSKSNSDIRTQWLGWRLRQHPSVSDLSLTKTSATTQGSEGLAPSAERVDPRCRMVRLMSKFPQTPPSSIVCFIVYASRPRHFQPKTILTGEGKGGDGVTREGM